MGKNKNRQDKPNDNPNEHDPSKEPSDMIVNDNGTTTQEEPQASDEPRDAWLDNAEDTTIDEPPNNQPTENNGETEIQSEHIETNTEETTMPETQPAKLEITQTTPPNVGQPQSIVRPAKTVASTLNELTNRYIAIARTGLNTSEKRKNSIGVLVKIADLVSKSHDRSVFDACLAFMVNCRSLLMGQNSIAVGVTEYAESQKVTRIIQFYTIFESLVESQMMKRRYTINLGHVRELFHNNTFVDWLSSKSKKQ